MHSRIHGWLPVALATAGLLLPACTAAPDATRWTQSSEQGYFQVTVEPGIDPVVINRMHDWIVTITDSAGQPVEEARIEVRGGMPEHQHGLPTVPEMTAALGGGRYRISGVRFSMAGTWEVTLQLRAGGWSDQVTFELELE